MTDRELQELKDRIDRISRVQNALVWTVAFLGLMIAMVAMH